MQYVYIYITGKNIENPCMEILIGMLIFPYSIPRVGKIEQILLMVFE